MRRTGPKGDCQFERVSWGEALGEIAERFGAVPGETILNAHYTGTFALLQPERSSSDHGPPAVDQQVVPGDHVRCARREEQHRAHDLVRLPDAAGWDRLRDPVPVPRLI
jgi:hypothetical protein